MIKIDPSFSCSQEIPQCPIGLTLGYREFELADKALGVSIIGWGASSAHGTFQAFEQENCACLLRSILASLVAMPNGAGNTEFHHRYRGDDQVSSHALIKSSGKDMSGSFPKSKTATHFGAICKRYFKDI
jgi:hypothetical protein